MVDKTADAFASIKAVNCAISSSYCIFLCHSFALKKGGAVI